VTSFVDAYAQRILGWHLAAAMATAIVLDAIVNAI